MKELTQREKQVYDYITETLKQKGYAPSVRDVRDALGFKSTSTVHMYIQRLADMGLIVKDGGKSRALFVDGAMGNDSVPLIGRVTAGKPILAEQDFEGYISFSPSSVGCRRENLYALRVRGESMKNAGILDGDIVIVDRRSYAENGEIVVALLEDEATVKTFFKEDGHFRLQPENPEFTPIIVQNVEILGKVVAALRLY
jgi:repressor LexA